MHRSQVAVIFVLALALLASSPVLPADEALGQRIDDYLEPFVQAGHLSGSILVARGGETLYSRSYGFANRELEVSNESGTRFCIASITKPMTQVIAIRLVERKRLALGDKLSKWIPSFPRAEEITVEMLLRHQAGIPHRVTTELEEAVPHSAAEMVELASAKDLLFDPGSDSAYSSGGYAILARVLELASGKSFSELLAEHVFSPAGLDSSLHPTGSALIPRRASSYRIAAGGAIVNAALKNYSFLVGAGSVFSTPGDLVKLMRGVVDGSFGELVTSQLLDEDGLSWNGRTNGYRAFADYDPESDVYVAFASNILTGAGDMLRRDLPRLVAGEKVARPRVPESRLVVVDPGLLESYEGDYELRPGSLLTLSHEDGEVRMSGWLLLPISDTSFFSPQDYGVVTVVRGEDGSVERLDWVIGDQTYPMPRVERAEP